MNQPAVSGKMLLALLCLSALILTALFVGDSLDSRTRVVFCNVGQGNGAYIRLRGIDVLIDTGPPGGGILACLGRHMPFYDRSIEYLVISHPQADHDGMLADILKRYAVRAVFVSAAFRQDPRILSFARAGTRFVYVTNGMEIELPGKARIHFLTSLSPAAGDNDRSLIVLLKTIGSGYLFTGDVTATVFSPLTRTFFSNKLILLVPHHGSATGLSAPVLKKLHPAQAVISVGKNAYGHPSRKTLDLLERYRIPYRRTDREGDIVFRED